MRVCLALSSLHIPIQTGGNDDQHDAAARTPRRARRESIETAQRSTTIAGDTFPRVDFYAIDDLLDRRGARDARQGARLLRREVIPIINDYWERAEFPFELIPKMAQLGIAGGAVQGYGCPGMSQSPTA